MTVAAVVISASSCRVTSLQPVDAQAPVIRISADLSVQRIAPDVWLHTSWRTLSDGARFPSNGLLVRDGTDMVLIDTAWGVHVTQQLLDWAASELGQTVTHAVATHFHDDRTRGAPVLAERAVALYATAATSRLTTATTPFGALEAGQATRFGPVEVFYPGPGHSDDNVVVWVPSAGAVFGGCLVKSAGARGMGNVADANMEQWPLAIDRVTRRYPNAKIVVPGHGRPGSTQLLAHTKQLLADNARQDASPDSLARRY